MLALLLAIGLLLLSLAGVVLTFAPFSMAVPGSSLGKAVAIYSVTGIAVGVLAFWVWWEWSSTSTLSVGEWVLASLGAVAGVFVFGVIQQGMENAKERNSNARTPAGIRDH